MSSTILNSSEPEVTAGGRVDEYESASKGVMSTYDSDSGVPSAICGEYGTISPCLDYLVSYPLVCVCEAPDAIGVGDMATLMPVVVTVVGEESFYVAVSVNSVVGTAAGKSGMVRTSVLESCCVT